MSPENRIACLVAAGLVVLCGLVVSDYLARRPAPARRPADGARAHAPAEAKPTANRKTPIPTPAALGERGGEAPDPRRSARPAPTERPESESGTDEAVTGPPDEEAASPSAGPENGPREGRVHRVSAGESLWEIAKRYYGSGARWRRIKRANPDAIGDDARVEAGVKLRIPPLPENDRPARAARDEPAARERGSSGETASETTAVRVEPGDTLMALARRHLGSADRWRALARANGIDRPDALRPGMKLELPERAASGQPARGGSPRDGTYVVRRGDTLVSIARSVLGDAGRWRRLLEANASRLDRPEDLEVGQRLAVPRS